MSEKRSNPRFGPLVLKALPPGFVMSGFGPVESMVLVVAAINLHHFVVDAFIWRLKSGEGNRRIVEGEPAAVTL